MRARRNKGLRCRAAAAQASGGREASGRWTGDGGGMEQPVPPQQGRRREAIFEHVFPHHHPYLIPRRHNHLLKHIVIVYMILDSLAREIFCFKNEGGYMVEQNSVGGIWSGA